MRLTKVQKDVLFKKVMERKKEEIKNRRAEILGSEEISSFIDVCKKEFSTLSEGTIKMIGHKIEPAKMPDEKVIREKAAWVLGIDLPNEFELNEITIMDDINYMSILADNIDELTTMLNNY